MDNYVANVIPHLQQWWPVLVRLAYLVGVAFAVVSLGQAISHKHRFNRSTAVWTFVCAVLLLNLPALMDSLSMTVFNQSSEQSLSYSPPSSPGEVYIQFGGILAVNLVTFLRGIGATIGGDVQTYIAKILG